jgi:hypothetical protein
MAFLPLISYQQFYIYDKLVIARGKIKNIIYFNVHHHVVVKEKNS